MSDFGLGYVISFFLCSIAYLVALKSEDKKREKLQGEVSKLKKDIKTWKTLCVQRSDIIADKEKHSDILEDALREIDTHIRCDKKPIPYIVETLKSNLPEYQSDDVASFGKSPFS